MWHSLMLLPLLVAMSENKAQKSMCQNYNKTKNLPAAWGGGGVALAIGGPVGGGVGFMVGGGPVGGWP